MSFTLLRAPIRRVAVSAATPRAAFRSSYRRFSTNPPPPPPKSSNAGLFAGFGIAALAGGAYYYYAISPAGADAGTAAKSALQSAKAAAKFTPSKEDYQKVPYYQTRHYPPSALTKKNPQVYNRIAEIIDDAGSYDGIPSALFHSDTCLMISYFQMVRMAPSSYDSPGTRLVRMIRNLTRVEGGYRLT
jgi:cytochrome c peroxidase